MPSNIFSDSAKQIFRQPGHTIYLLPTVVICNLLPCELDFYVKGMPINGTLKPGKEAALPTADTSQNIELGKAEGWPSNIYSNTVKNTREYFVSVLSPLEKESCMRYLSELTQSQGLCHAAVNRALVLVCGYGSNCIFSAMRMPSCRMGRGKCQKSGSLPVPSCNPYSSTYLTHLIDAEIEVAMFIAPYLSFIRVRVENSCISNTKQTPLTTTLLGSSRNSRIGIVSFRRWWRTLRKDRGRWISA